ncbi:MAG: M20/M25/M40 family metallo-hydrolase [Chitinophagaceae bacterium]|nr:M20/M25/M40 family metallo-hydrolase [Chitinophagaceae bacterium]
MIIPRISLGLLAAILITGCHSTKKITKADTSLSDSLKVHISFLADDRLEGRRTGTPGEELARDYISQAFARIGLLPKGTEWYPQSFQVNEGRQIDSVTEFVINGNRLQTGKEFFPFPFSGDAMIEAMPAIAVQELEMPWFIDLKETLEENQKNPHFDLPDYIRTNSKKAKDRGATAIILYNSSVIEDKLVFDKKDRSPSPGIPVLYVAKEAAKKYFSDSIATLNIKLRSSVSDKMRGGYNVIGYIDNKAPTTVIVGAHYDHLGYGEDGNSRHTSHEAAIHNGADDNASGTAALIELARKLKTSNATANNYLFIAFSGEELGLYGSKYFTDHPTVDLKSVNYMINMDMVGRLSDSNKVLTVGGYGTSPAWGEYYKQFDQMNNGPANPGLIFKYDSSGTGPSDHTSFYRKDIPVLFYFTGLHTDYHKPSDDADKINYNGQAKIVEHIYSLVEWMNARPRLAFTKTRETQTTTSARFSVSMGIMPDYTFTGAGVKADGVSEGKPAQKAGLKAGDIILQIGEYNVSSMESYMQTLGKFKKGDKAKVKYQRGKDVLETTVEF